MSRRLVAVLSICCVAALGVSAVALAHGNGSREHKGGKHAARHHAGQPGDARFFGRSLDSLAQRLAVDPAALKTAVKQVVAEQRAKRQAAGPDAAAAKPDLAALKTELATSLATKLGKTPDEVLAAVRAELDARLTQAVAAGWLTQKGHDLALACFDAPQSCDMKALQAEVKWFGHGKQRKHHRDGATTSTPPTTMTPGARSTSTPLR